VMDMDVPIRICPVDGPEAESANATIRAVGRDAPLTGFGIALIRSCQQIT